MKLFWALIALLVLGTVALLASGALSGDSRGDSVQASTPASPTISVVQPSSVKPSIQVESAASPVSSPSPSQPPVVAAPTPAHIAVTPAAGLPVPAEPADNAQKQPAAQPILPSSGTEAAEPVEDTSNPLIALRKEIEAQRAVEAAQKEAQKAAAQAAVPAADPAAAESPASSDASFAGAKVETKPDGSLLIDGKYTVKGKGTQEEPYKVTWDQLLSAQNEYAPKEGRKTIPPRIQALNDKWLDITGYVAFPLMTTEADELLSMMNQWDGCCIGVPPTPYDAVEVRLSNAVSGNARLTTYGSVRGKFKVDPHLVGGWLVGLYVMDQAKLTPVSYGGIAP